MSYSIKRNKQNQLVVNVPISYEVIDAVEITVDSFDELQEKLNNHHYVGQLPLGDDPVYVDGSYEINHDHLDYMIDIFKEKEE